MSLIGNFAVEFTKGSKRTAVEHTDLESGETNTDFIDQLGNMYAIGIDYDLSRKTSFHLRTKYMSHVDKNFNLDSFSGLETTFELKIFL
jgi:predicted porin